MERIDNAIKVARESHTKVAWEDFYRKFGDLVASCPQPRLVNEIFKKLSDDPQSIHYNPALWGALLQGSLACWNLQVGCEIAEYVKRLLVPVVSVHAAQILLEAGHPAASREYAHRALRGVGLETKERLQLEMIVASSFAEEGKSDKAIKTLEKIGPSIREAQLTVAERATFLNRLGRLHYFIGRYSEAAKAFEEASPLFLELHEWESAARALFNVGACYQNSGEGTSQDAFRVVEECRRIAVEHDLHGPLSHCEAFYGFEAYHCGSFAAARDHFRRALAVLPANDKSFRRLHVLSMLSLTYFATGKYTLAKKFAKQTIDLASLDESDRFKIRYQALEAELLWEEGNIPQSMETLRVIVETLAEQGVHTLEELSALTRYITQSAFCGNAIALEKFRIDAQLTKNQYTWLEHEYACALLRANYVTPDKASEGFEACLKTARSVRALHYEALCLLGMIRGFLRTHNLTAVRPYVRELEIAVSRLGDSPLKAKLQCVYAGIAYQEGDFDRAVKILSGVEKTTTISFPDLFAVQCCLATIRGQSPRLLHDWQYDLVARFVKNYFAPTIAMPEPRIFVIAGHYTVNLEKHPSLAELLAYLIERPAVGALPSDIQTDVWKQSIQAQGWQQKIRNAIMRLRDLFPYTIAPIILHNDAGVRFFASAIGLESSGSETLSLEILTRRVLAEGPLSSQQVADRLHTSLATAKRAIKKLSDNREIRSEKNGRSIVYRAVMVKKPPTAASTYSHNASN